MKKVIAFALFALLTLNASFAQVALGLKAGAQFNNVYMTDVLNQVTPDFQYAAGWTLGGVAEVNFGEYFALQPELNFVQKGFAWDESAGVALGNIEIPLGARATFRSNYLEMPVLAKVKLGNDRVKAYAVAGPAIGYALNAKIITRPRLLFELDPFETSVNLDNLNYERLELSATGGVGVQANFNGVSVFADARYTHGFTELYNFPVVNEKIRNRSFALSAGVMVNLQPTQQKPKRLGAGRPRAY